MSKGTVSVFTLGCKTNLYESEQLVTRLNEVGFEAVTGLVKADYFVLNTCAVTSEAESKSRQAVARAKKLNPLAKVVITGCASQKNAEQFGKMQGVTYVCGNADKLAVVKHLLNESNSTVKEDLLPLPTTYLEGVNATQGKTRAFIKIQDGCNNFCSYCIVPYLRGRSRSRSIQSIKQEIQLNPQSNEFVLLGIDISQYGLDSGCDLATLLDNLSDVKARIRLGSIYQDVINERFLTSMSANVCKHLHLSLQSGSDSVLKDMNRHYNTQDFFDKTVVARRFYPEIGLTTDIIVGYPTETEQHFQQTCDFATAVGFSDVHVFPYSPRKGTTAFHLGKLSEDVVKDRVARLTQIKQTLKKNFATKYLGTTAQVLVEEYKKGYFIGYTDNYLRVYFKGKAQINTFAQVKINQIFLDGVKGEL